MKRLLSVTTAGAVASTNSTPVNFNLAPSSAVLVLNVTAAATDAGDTLDVKVQTNLGGSWTDVCYFTQVLGNGGAKRFGAKLMSQTAFTLGDVAGALTAGNIRHLLGPSWRVNYVVVDANANSAFTFTVDLIPTW